MSAGTITTTEIASSDPNVPRIWEPEKDDDQADLLTGELLGYKMQGTKHGDRVVAYVRETGSGQVWSRMLTGVLPKQFAECHPNLGQIVQITYGGEKVSQSGPYAGKMYRSWRVEVAPDGTMVPDWDALANGEAKLVQSDALPAPARAAIPATVDEDIPSVEVTVPDVSDDDIPF